MMASPASRSAPSDADRLLGDLPCRDHDPRPARHLERGDEVLERVRTRCSLGHERRDGIGADVVDHAGVAVAHQAAHDVRAHPAQANHAELHGASLYARMRDERWIEACGRRDAGGRGRRCARRSQVTDGRDTIEIHEAEGAFELLEGWLRDARLLRAGRRGSRRRPVPRIRPLLDDPAPALERSAGAVPAAACRLCRPAAGVRCQE